jgi:hypothetical protein
MNTNYNQQSKLTPRQISSFNKLNPFILEKDYSLTPSSNLTYKEYFTRYYHNNNGSLGQLKKSDLVSQKLLSKKRKKEKNNFHTSCPFTKRKKCWCKFFNDPIERNINSFINKLHNGEIDIDISGENIKFYKNEEFLKKKENIKKEKEIIDEQIRIINFNDLNKEYFMKLNEKNLFIKDYKEIERKINEDKKKCQKCGCSLNGEESRKGWKNELGEYNLICNACARRYYDGAHEVRYDSHTSDSQMNYNHNYSMPNPSYSQNYYNNINNNMKSGMNYSQMRNVSNLSGSYYTGYSGNNNNYKNNDNFEQSMKNNSMGPGYQNPNKTKFINFQVQKNDMNK